MGNQVTNVMEALWKRHKITKSPLEEDAAQPSLCILVVKPLARGKQMEVLPLLFLSGAGFS